MLGASGSVGRRAGQYEAVSNHRFGSPVRVGRLLTTVRRQYCSWADFSSVLVVGANSFALSCSAEVERNQSNHVAHFARFGASSTRETRRINFCRTLAAERVA